MTQLAEYIKNRHLDAVRFDDADIYVGEVWEMRDGRHLRIEILDDARPWSAHHHKLVNVKTGQASYMMDHIFREKLAKLISGPTDVKRKRRW